MIRFDCPHCGKGLRTDVEMAGKAFNCPSCRGRVSVPSVSSDGPSERRTRAETSGRFKVQAASSPAISQTIARTSMVAILAAVIAGTVLILLEIPWTVVIPVVATIVICGIVVAWLLGQISRCSKCGRRKQSRSLGVIHRDAPAAKEALEFGDLAALGALSHEGEAIQVVVTTCPGCHRDAPIEIQFIPVDAARPARMLAHVVYPGAALPVFERLCQREESGASVP